MIVFKTFLKVLNKNKVPIILFTVMLIIFGGMNMKNSDSVVSFTEEKADIVIINKDEEVGVTKNLIEYLEARANVKDILEEKIDDAVFYRDVNYVIYIPDNYRNDFLNNKNPQIEIKQTGDYNASLEEMILDRYLRVADAYLKVSKSEEEIIRGINSVINEELDVIVTSKLDADEINNAAFYYNFMNYSMLAGSIYVIALIISSFRSEVIRKRITVSSMDYKKHNRILLLSNLGLTFILWLIYVFLSFILCGKIMFSIHGLIFMINSFIFAICTTSLAFLISILINKKEVINGVVNVIALGSSFLCGAFVPVEFLPNMVLRIAHILPSYYYINTNEMVKSLEVVNIETLRPLIVNMGIVIIFSIIFMIVTNIITKRKQKIN